MNFFNFTNIDFIDNDDIAAKILQISKENRYIVVIDILNPIVDIDLINKMIDSLEVTSKNYAICDGAIPGTQAEYIVAPKVNSSLDLQNSDEITLVRWFSQDSYNNQFNLYKYKRLKMFLALLNKVENLYTLSIKEIIDKLNDSDIFNSLVAYGEDIKLYEYTKCPHCKGRLISLHMNMSQPFCGYIPSSRALYHECEKCGLIVMSPYVDQNETAKIYDIYDKQDFAASLNNPYKVGTPRCDFSDFINILPKSVRTLDLGGGMGFFSKFLKSTYPHWNVTHADFEIKSDINLEGLDIKTKALDFTANTIGKECYDFITAWEVLEHIPYEKLEETLNNIYNALSNGGIFMFSTPDFDSPLCKSNDFYATCPPFHYLVFTKRWLESYFKNTKWNIHSIRHCSDFLDDSEMWYDYVGKTAPSFQLRATSEVLRELLSIPQNKKLLLEKGMGTEVIFTLIKQ